MVHRRDEPGKSGGSNGCKRCPRLGYGLALSEEHSKLLDFLMHSTL